MSSDFTGVILDVDGTLVDSNDAHARAWVDAFRQEGFEVPYAQVRSLIGMGADNLLPTTVGVTKESDEGKRLSKAWEEIFKENYLPGLQPTPGAEQLLRTMKARGLKLAVASSSEPGMLQSLLDIVGAADLIEEQTSSGDAARSKPDPDIVRAALDKIGLPAEQVVMVGDTPYDITAARGSGIPIIALRCGGWGSEDLRDALAIYNDPADLLAQYEASPLALGGYGDNANR